MCSRLLTSVCVCVCVCAGRRANDWWWRNQSTSTSQWRRHAAIHPTYHQVARPGRTAPALAALLRTSHSSHGPHADKHHPPSATRRADCLSASRCSELMTSIFIIVSLFSPTTARCLIVLHVLTSTTALCLSHDFLIIYLITINRVAYRLQTVRTKMSKLLQCCHTQSNTGALQIYMPFCFSNNSVKNRWIFIVTSHNRASKNIRPIKYRRDIY